MQIYSVPHVVPESIFRAYDIRGIVDETLTPNIVYAIGLAIGSEAKELNQHKIAIGRDGRLSGPILIEALAQGLLDAGCDVIDIGMVPTPVLYFAAATLDTRSGVMLTGSHNPVNYNGLKIVLAGETLTEDRVTALYQRIKDQKFSHGHGKREFLNIIPTYISTIVNDVKLQRPLKVVIDAGNGATGEVAPTLFAALGCEVIPLFCEIDGHFPNHHPDPSRPENLEDIIRVVKKEHADLGLAFDGDGDRCGVITGKGENIWADRQMMLFAIDLLQRHPGAEILFDVKCTRNLPTIIEQHGGKPIMWKTGHSLLKKKMREMGALLAGEMSGHIFFKERWYGFDDGMYTGVRLLEILSRTTRTASEIFSELPDSLNTPELKLPMEESEKFSFMQKLIAETTFSGGKITTIDGLRVDFADGWGLIRPSNTTPYLILRFEADDEKSLQQIQTIFRQQLLAVDAALKLPF